MIIKNDKQWFQLIYLHSMGNVLNKKDSISSNELLIYQKGKRNFERNKKFK